MKYTYSVDINKMEEIYFEHTQTNFFTNDEQRNKFNAKLIVEADTEQEAERIRMGMTDIRMWNLDESNNL